MEKTIKIYKGFIGKLRGDQIFVFGANNQGRHGKGTALKARLEHGAIYGVGEGRMGLSYGIVTKDLRCKIHPSIPKDVIELQIIKLYEYAINNDDLHFFVAYTGTGVNDNKYSPQEMAEMFSCAPIPDNLVFEEEFAKLLVPGELTYTFVEY